MEENMEEEMPKERTGTVLSVRFSAEELDQLRQEAERAGMAVSAFVRKFVLARHATPSQATTSSSNVTSDLTASPGIQVTGYRGLYARIGSKNR
jgi:hypothetical protein